MRRKYKDLFNKNCYLESFQFTINRFVTDTQINTLSFRMLKNTLFIYSVFLILLTLQLNLVHSKTWSYLDKL